MIYLFILSYTFVGTGLAISGEEQFDDWGTRDTLITVFFWPAILGWHLGWLLKGHHRP